MRKRNFKCSKLFVKLLDARGDIRALHQFVERHTSRKMLENKQDKMLSNMPWFKGFSSIFSSGRRGFGTPGVFAGLAASHAAEYASYPSVPKRVALMLFCWLRPRILALSIVYFVSPLAWRFAIVESLHCLQHLNVVFFEVATGTSNAPSDFVTRQSGHLRRPNSGCASTNNALSAFFCLVFFCSDPSSRACLILFGRTLFFKSQLE